MCIGKSFDILPRVGSIPLSNAILEGNSNIAVKATNSSENINVDYGVFIEDARRMLQERQDWSVCYTYKKENNNTHMLAKHALSIDGKNVCIEDGLLLFFPLIMKEKYCNV